MQMVWKNNLRGLKVYRKRKMNLLGFKVPAYLFTGILGAVLIMCVPVYASDNTGDCFDIVGRGKEVLRFGVPNSGYFNFDPVAGFPAFQYEGCVDDPDIPPEANRSFDNNFGAPGADYYQVKGWVWDTNLGWISLFCESNLNEGRPCGSAGIDYGVTIDDAGYFHGWAWGDNVGWISFNCDDTGAAGCGVSTYQPYVEVTDPDCMGYVYGSVSPKPAFCVGHAEAERATHVWADSVGWFDLDGIAFPLVAMTNEIGNVEFRIKPDRPANYNKNTPATPVANNSDAYYFEVYVEDKDGNPFDPGDPTRYEVHVIPNWWRDSVKLNQTVDGVVPTYTSCEPGGAVNKFCNETILSPAVSTGYYESADITSSAPTSNMNGYDGNNDGDIVDPEDFPYETFVSPSDKASATFDSNDLILNMTDVRIVDTDFSGTAGECAYPISGFPCGWENPLPDSGDFLHDFKFLPQTEVTVLNGPTSNEYIELDVMQPALFTANNNGGTGSVEFTAGIDTLDTVITDNLKFVIDTNSDSILDWVDLNTWSLVGSVVGDFLASVVTNPNPTGQPPQTVGGLYVYTEVDEGGGVRYFSNKLPRVIGSTAIQPVAVLRGSVYSSGYITTTSAVSLIRSIGDVSTNILRDTIFRNVSAIIAGASVTQGDSVVETGSGNKLVITGANGTTLLPDDSGDPTVFYFKGGDVTIGNGTDDVTWDGDRTIIVVGGNVIIRNNIYNPPPSSAKLGIIVMRDLADTAAQKAVTGHVYVMNDVTNIQANIYADGSMFPWDGFVLLNGNGRGEPEFPTLLDAKAALETHQLFIQGNIVSQNTVGGTRLSQPIIGTGEPANDELQARVYDLNYLRYYSGLIQRNAAGEPICKDGAGTDETVATEADFNSRLQHPTTGEPWSVYETYLDFMTLKGGCLWPPNEAGTGMTFYNAEGLDPLTDLGATYIYFDPPSPNLPGFTYSRGVETTLRAQ